MTNRMRISNNPLPNYSHNEEITNSLTHILGAVISIPMLLMGLWKSNDTISAISVLIYGISMLLVYSCSGIYHGMESSYGKKVMQIVDHCVIYALIAGTYTPILTIALMPVSPQIAAVLLVMEWALGILAAILTAIDMKKYKVFSMICYILMGWAIIFFCPSAISAMTMKGFQILFAGGCAYTVGAIVYGIGAKVPWMHSVFHVFVLIGSTLQYISIYLYVL